MHKCKMTNSTINNIKKFQKEHFLNGNRTYELIEVSFLQIVVCGDTCHYQLYK